MAVVRQEPLGVLAQGTFGKGARIAPEAVASLNSGEFTRPVNQWLFGTCGDERCDLHGARLLVPAAFGGFAALVVIDALTVRTWYKPGMTFEEHLANMFEAVKAEYPDAKLSLHTDTSAKPVDGESADECGCAAVAKAAAVLQLLVVQQDQIDPDYRDDVVRNAQELLDSGYIQPKTATVVEHLAAKGMLVELLAGEHDGVALIRNHRKGTVIDRPALYKACEEAGIPVLKAFEYDVWAMREAAEQLAGDDAALYFAAGDALMMTTKRAIGHPDLVVIDFE